MKKKKNEMLFVDEYGDAKSIWNEICQCCGTFTVTSDNTRDNVNDTDGSDVQGILLYLDKFSKTPLHDNEQRFEVNTPCGVVSIGIISKMTPAEEEHPCRNDDGG